ncbi:hypothetical protein [Kocuria massiliensis]|uniref:glycoside hydrolase family 30 protein n=1 Tax=Kocuria massiliensis TaxID=1926282 RepID=UPI001301E2C8|nr:hypothetical protein [Kocuria massiliensis]MCT1368049.1 hypothetical protein [Rothia sp. p3-SID1597]
MSKTLRMPSRATLGAISAVALVATSGILSSSAAMAEDPTNSANLPDLGNNGTSFHIQAGDADFDTAMPDKSVATYVMKKGQKPTMYLTTADQGKNNLKYKVQQFDAENTSGGPSSGDIRTKPDTNYGQVAGFGATMTDSAAFLLQHSPNRDEIMQKLYGQGADDAHLNIARAPMGSTDLMSDPDDYHSLQDGGADTFSIDKHPSDQREIEMLQQAKKLSGQDFKLIGTPWTAPGWAKKSGQLHPGNDDGGANELNMDETGDYAQYFKKYAEAYDQIGLKPWMVSLQNEPLNPNTKMPTTQLSKFVQGSNGNWTPDAAEAGKNEVTLAHAVKQALPQDVGILGWDHNTDTPDGSEPVAGSDDVDMMGYHSYNSTNPSGPNKYQDQSRKKNSLMSEGSNMVGETDARDKLGDTVEKDIMGPMRHGALGSLYWSLMQDSQGNPHFGSDDSCDSCRGLVTATDNGNYELSQEYYYYSQFSRFVEPGSTNIESNNSGNLSSVAFQNGDTTTVVVLNDGDHKVN